MLDERKIWYYMPVQNGLGVTGIPDFICCWLGRFLTIETKAPGKRANTTPNQKRVGLDIQRADGMYVVVDEVSQLVSFLNLMESVWPTLQTQPTTI